MPRPELSQPSIVIEMSVPEAPVAPVQALPEEVAGPRPSHLPQEEKFYLVKDPLSKEHDGPFTVSQIKAIAAQPGFPYQQAYVFKHGDNQMSPLASMPIFSRRTQPANGAINASLPDAALQNEAENDEWYVYGDEEKTYGPYTHAQICEALEAGHITRTTYVWQKGMQEWIYAWQVPGSDRRQPAEQAKAPIPLTQIKKSA
jgi:hypothetical protein